MRKIKILFILFPALLTGGCSDMLEKAPYASVSDASFYKTAADAEMAVNAVYTQLKQFNTFNAFSFLPDIWADDCVKGGGGPGDTAELTQFEIWEINNSNWLASGRWSAFFQGVYYANVAIKKISAMDDFTNKARLIGEAKFLRALYYFCLVNDFGALPLITDPDAEDLKELKRSPVADVYKQIIQDLTDAAAALPYPKDYSGTDLGRASKGSALGLLGRVYLFTKEWQKASDTYGEIIKSGQYDLMSDFAANFTNTGADNLKESLFEVQYASGTGNTGNGFQRHGWVRPRDVAEISWGGNGFAEPTESLAKEFEEGDLRRPATVMVEGDKVWDSEGGMTTEYKSSWSPYSGYNAMKYVYGPEAIHGECDANFKLIRYSEVLLGYSEAVLNGASATVPNFSGLDALNKVRTRAGLGGKTSYALADIIHERRVELALEGFRFYDVVRWGKASEIFGSQFNVGKDELMPIPESEILKNPNLDQNPGY